MFRLHRSPAARLLSAGFATKSVAPPDIAHFRSILPPSSIVSTLYGASQDELEPFNNDWMGRFRGAASTVLKPKTTQQVSEILKYCNKQGIPVVPQGGNTGLVGGSVPIKHELVLSLANMNNVRSFDPVSGVLVADAGCILQSLTDHVAPHNHIMPIDLGAKGSCQIGGNVSTNAGGLRLLRYGSLHGSVLGLEVVLPDGTILDQLTTLRKDNTGYDLKQLFIGAEGTLGVITGVSILTPPAPQASNNVILALPSFSNVLPLFQTVKRHLSEILSAFEYIDRTAYNLAVKHGQGRALSDEDVNGAECFVLIETSGGRREHDEEKLSDLLELLLTAENPLVTSGVLSQSPAQFSSLWALREGVTEAVSKEGKAYKYDISIPLSSFKDVVDGTREHLKSKGLMHEKAVKYVLGYGHVGDGNLHLNICADAYLPEIQSALEPYIYEVVASHRGSVSAEHGIGAQKTHALHYSKDAVSIELMRRIKNVFDPNGIMNPGKPIFHDSSSIPIKFFIQKDLPQDIQTELCDTIVTLGGRVESKVPRQGFILIQPGSPEAERLLLCWKSEERPERYFVPYTYVEACKIAGKIIRQIFLENGRPIPIHIHSSIANINTRHSVSSRIVHAGGEADVPIQAAKVILADPETDVFRELVKTYQSVPDVHIESFLWVKKCIDKGALAYTPVVYKNPGGRRVGEERTAFTSEDEQNLCKWIAVKIPYKDSGGRTGNRLYQQLCELSDQPDFAWVTRHTWQSWRERYKKNADRLDRFIAEIVEETKPALGEKGQYGYVRQDEDKKVRRTRKRKAAETEDHLQDFTLPEHHDQQDPNATAAESVTLNSQVGVSVDASNESSRAYASILPPSAPPLDPGAVRKSPAEEEQDEDPEWAIRIGNDPPPPWAKPRVVDNIYARAVKRLRTNEPNDHNAGGPSGGPPPAPLSQEALVQIANMHVIDQALQAIAREFRFTLEEVKEYYDKCGEMTTTRARFQKMRNVLNSLEDD